MGIQLWWSRPALPSPLSLLPQTADHHGLLLPALQTLPSLCSFAAELNASIHLLVLLGFTDICKSVLLRANPLAWLQYSLQVVVGFHDQILLLHRLCLCKLQYYSCLGICKDGMFIKRSPT